MRWPRRCLTTSRRRRLSTNVYRRNSFIHYEWRPEKVFKVVAEQMVMERVDDKEQKMVNNVALFRTF